MDMSMPSMILGNDINEILHVGGAVGMESMCNMTGISNDFR